MRIESQDKALIAAKAALNKHAEDVLVMDLRRLSSVADFFVIATATSSRQVQAMTEQIEEELRRVGHRVWHVEGLVPPAATRPTHPLESDSQTTLPAPRSAWQAGNGLSWVLMDCGDLVIHLFNPPARHFYQLERLWGDAPRIPLES